MKDRILSDTEWLDAYVEWAWELIYWAQQNER